MQHLAKYVGGRGAVEERLTPDRNIAGLIPALPAHVSKCPRGRH